MNIPILNNEQKKREKILFDLMKALNHQDRGTNLLPCATEIVLTGYHDEMDKPLWMHFTDWYAEIDLKALLEGEFIEFHPTLFYTKNGSVHDDFPPTAYRLTDKGKFILRNRALWVFDGNLRDLE